MRVYGTRVRATTHQLNAPADRLKCRLQLQLRAVHIATGNLIAKYVLKLIRFVEYTHCILSVLIFD